MNGPTGVVRLLFLWVGALAEGFESQGTESSPSLGASQKRTVSGTKTV